MSARAREAALPDGNSGCRSASVRKASQPTRKPNSVRRRRPRLAAHRLRRDDHSSRPGIARGLQRPTRRLRTGRPLDASTCVDDLGAALFGLAPCGVLPATDVTAGAVRSYRTFSPLPQLPEGGIFSVPLIRQIALPGRYPAHCPPEFGLSSRLRRWRHPCGCHPYGSRRSSGRLRRFDYRDTAFGVALDIRKMVRLCLPLVNANQVSTAFGALSDPTRRAIFERLPAGLGRRRHRPRLPRLAPGGVAAPQGAQGRRPRHRPRARHAADLPGASAGARRAALVSGQLLDHGTRPFHIRRRRAAEDTSCLTRCRPSPFARASPWKPPAPTPSTSSPPPRPNHIEAIRPGGTGETGRTGG